LDEKIELVDEHRGEHGLNACLRALGVSKGMWHYRMRGGLKAAEKRADDEALKEPIVEIITANPAYGYRRIKPELEEAVGEVVNDKRLRRLLNEWDLSLRRTVSRPEPSPIRRILSEARGHLNLVRGLDPGPLEVLSTDFTEIRYAGGSRKAWLIALVDLDSSWTAGWAVGPSANRELALRAWIRTREAFGRLGEDVDGMIIHQTRTPSSPATPGFKRCSWRPGPGSRTPRTERRATPGSNPSGAASRPRITRSSSKRRRWADSRT